MEFYEKVRVNQQDRMAEYAGHEGIVIGIGEDEGRGMSVTVIFPDNDDVVMFWDHELTGTGVVVDRAEVYDGDSAHVVVDHEGRGELAD